MKFHRSLKAQDYCNPALRPYVIASALRVQAWNARPKRQAMLLAQARRFESGTQLPRIRRRRTPRLLP